MSHFIKGKNVSLRAGNKNITHVPFEFNFPKGKWAAIIGPNGAGKSTLLRELMGLASQSEVRLEDNRDVRELKRFEIPSVFGFVPQEQLYPRETKVLDFLRLAFLPRMGWINPLPPGADKEINDALEILGNLHLSDRTLGQLSTGERQKIFLARAILQKPRILILDEPTSHLDPGASVQFWKALQNIHLETGTDVVISTHDLSLIQKYDVTVLALKKGDRFHHDSNISDDLISELFDMKE